MGWSSIWVWSWSVPVAALVGVFVLGGLWYSPWLFGTAWNREVGVNPKEGKRGHPAIVFGVSFVMGLISAQATHWGLRIYWICMESFSAMPGQADITEWPLFLGRTAFVAFMFGVAFVATSFTINYMFSGRSWKLLAIDAGYHILQFTSYGVIFGLWPGTFP